MSSGMAFLNNNSFLTLPADVQMCVLVYYVGAAFLSQSEEQTLNSLCADLFYLRIKKAVVC